MHGYKWPINSTRTRTANTMAAFNEAVGMSLPGSASSPAMSRASGGKEISPAKIAECATHVDALFAMMKTGLTARQVPCPYDACGINRPF